MQNKGRKGGSINIDSCKEGCSYLINSTEFNGNSASQTGGSVYYVEERPEMNEIVFVNNSANQGKNIGSFGLKYLLNGTSLLELNEVASS